MKATIDGDLVSGTGSGDMPGVDIPPALRELPRERLRFDGDKLIDASSVTVWHIDGDGLRHIVAAPGRVELHCAFADEIERDGAGWRVVDQLARLKERRKAAIDEEAERQRLRWITPGAGQAMTYQAKVEEARRLKALSDPSTAAPGGFPMLAAEVGVTATTMLGVADVVLAAYQSWLLIGAAIEGVRLGAKDAIELAGNAADVLAIRAIWPEPTAS